MTRTWPSGSGIESAPKAPHPAHHCPCPRCRRHRQLELEALVEDDLLDPEIAGEATPTKVPTPGRYYEIQHGKGGLLTTAGRAYGVGSGPERLAHAKAINDHPNNRKFWVNPSNDYERQHFRAGIIDFRPQFRCDREQKRASSNEKKCFARIYIPPIGRPSGPNTTVALPRHDVSSGRVWRGPGGRGARVTRRRSWRDRVGGGLGGCGREGGATPAR
jgi:hypothetical protein